MLYIHVSLPSFFFQQIKEKYELQMAVQNRLTALDEERSEEIGCAQMYFLSLTLFVDIILKSFITERCLQVTTKNAKALQRPKPVEATWISRRKVVSVLLTGRELFWVT